MTPVCTIDASGIRKPTFAACLEYFQAQFRGIYGSDIYIEPDSQDGQWLAIMATALDDANAMAVSVFNSFSPNRAQGEGLSSRVKINGLARKVASYSMADVVIVGEAGAILTGCKVTDAGGYGWSLPENIIIPQEGQITVTAVCDTLGAITAPAGTLTSIATPTYGWQSVTNPEAAEPGAPVEVDAALRVRQSASTMISASYVLESIEGGLQAIGGVSRLKVYENDQSHADANGIPGHCIAAVVDGGDAQMIAKIIAGKKGGCGTLGDTIEDVEDVYGVMRRIAFFRPTSVPITYRITVKPAARGYTMNTEAAIKKAVADWTNARGIGGGISLGRVFLPANLFGKSEAFTVESIMAARDGHALEAEDIAIAFNEAAYCEPGYVTIKVP